MKLFFLPKFMQLMISSGFLFWREHLGFTEHLAAVRFLPFPNLPVAHAQSCSSPSLRALLNSRT
jgi:hypothetical protein